MGGIHVPAEQVGQLERAIGVVCESVGFPKDQEFKWSPGKKEDFQRNHLTGEARVEFYRQLLELARNHHAKALIVVEDESRRRARTTSKNHEHDVTALFLERADWSLSNAHRLGVVVAAAPQGAARGQGKFLADCAELLQAGTEFMKLDRIALGVLTAKSQQLRLLQLADIVTSCTVARVAGESDYSPEIFDLVLPLFRVDRSRVGGIGLKIHPDFVYANLYHWLLGDTHFWKGNCGHPLPIKGRPFDEDPGEGSHELKAVQGPAS